MNIPKRELPRHANTPRGEKSQIMDPSFALEARKKSMPLPSLYQHHFIPR